jgi:hypothetical protein
MCGEYFTTAKYYLECVWKKINLKTSTKCIKKKYDLIHKVDEQLIKQNMSFVETPTGLSLTAKHSKIYGYAVQNP